MRQGLGTGGTPGSCGAGGRAVRQAAADVGLTLSGAAPPDAGGGDSGGGFDWGLVLFGAIFAGIAEVKDSRVSVPAKHRLFLRTVAAAFDAHFVAAPNRHAKAV